MGKSWEARLPKMGPQVRIAKERKAVAALRGA